MNVEALSKEHKNLSRIGQTRRRRTAQNALFLFQVVKGSVTRQKLHISRIGWGMLARLRSSDVQRAPQA